MEITNAVVLPLHDYKKYLDICCKLINEEWPRSTTPRMHSLESSCDNLPTSLILVVFDSNTGSELVIGHSKISPLHKMPNGCFVESVVVGKKFRGQGWGRYIMLETEKYAKSKGKSVLYLSTNDKREFYEKLGYVVCEPVSIYGGRGFEIKNNFLSSFLSPSIIFKSMNSPASKPSTSSCPPAPPPPKSNLYSANKKVYMRKVSIILH